MIKRAYSLFRNLFRRRRVETDLDAELRAHLDLLIDENLSAGMSESDARRAARRELGHIDLLKAQVREVRMGAMLEQTLQDVRYGVRMLRRDRGFATVAILTIALGIGANTAIFSIVNGVLLRPLPYRDPSRLAMLLHNNTKENKPQDFLAYQTFLDLREQNKSFIDLAGITPVWRFGLGTEEGRETLQGYYVSASFFSLLGVEPIQGRSFLPDEDKQGGKPAVILSYRLWQRIFEGRADALGKDIDVDGQSTPVVGVLPPDFKFGGEGDLWMPLGQNYFFARGSRTVRVVSAVGRLAPGVTLSEAYVEAQAIAARLAQDHPDSNAGLDAYVSELQEHIVGKTRSAMLMLLGAVAFVLLMTCTNLANLLVARASTREREIAVRMALGAGRGRLLRQLLTESVVLSFSGGIAGLGLAYLSLRFLRAMGPPDLPRLNEVSIDGTVLLFTIAASVLTGVIFGLLPAFHALRASLSHSVKDGAKIIQTHGRSRTALAITEVALAIVMLVGAGLMIRSFARVMSVDPGFSSGHLLTLQLDLPPSYATKPELRRALYQDLFPRLEALPGVKLAGGVTRLPLGAGVTTKLEIEGRQVAVGDQPEVEFRRASVHYFDSMGIALRSGRTFTEQDGPTSPQVAVVNEAAASRFWPADDPIGRRVRFFGDANGSWFTIVGVIANVKHFGLDQQAPAELYMSFDQGPPGGPRIAIRTSVEPASLIQTVRGELRALDKQLAISSVETMDDIVNRSTAERRFQAVLLGAFALLALSLAAVGIYGVMSYGVAQRTQEIGIRMALGAQCKDVFRSVIRQGIVLASAGVMIGLGSALVLTRFLRALLFEVQPTDPITFAGVSVLLMLVALLACFIPARRAASVDPIVALRYE
jgi:putative ABC transport system permease protein